MGDSASLGVMRVLIMTDMEGVSGMVVWNQVQGGDPMYEECRRLYTEEINAAVRGAKAAGATEIHVVDCHGAGGGWTFNSLVPELLDPDCEWVAHHPWSGTSTCWRKDATPACWSGCMHGRLRRTACCATRSRQPNGVTFGCSTTLMWRSWNQCGRFAATTAFLAFW